MSDEEEGLGYWMRWQVSVCSLIIIIPFAVATAVISRGGRDPLRSVDLWVPCWSKLHPLWLLVYRGLVFLILSWLLYQMVLLDSVFAFYFYTQWTFTLVIIYFAIATLMSAHGCWNYSKQHVRENEETNGFLRRDVEENKPATLASKTYKDRDIIKLKKCHGREDGEQRAGFFGYVMQVVYQTCGGAVMLTDVVFWGLLVPFLSVEHFSLTLLMGCMHTLNAVFLLLDTALNSLPFPWFRMAYFVLLSCIYVIFQWILHACGFSWWPYPFLELSTPWAPLWYFCLALVHIPCYSLYYLIVKGKNSFLPKYFPNAYISPC